MPERVARGNAVPSTEVRSMFDRIAPVYDLMNSVMTLGLDARWRRTAARAADLDDGGRALDVACGTGALTEEMARGADVAEVDGIDLSPRMIERARRRVPSGRFAVADALALPFPDGSFDAATIGFGLRNMPDYGACLAEMVRVVRPGGRVVVLEIAAPEHGPVAWVLRAWFERVVPLLGRLAGAAGAYRYLPASVRAYPDPLSVAELMRGAGMTDVRWRRLRPGLVTLHVGRVA